MEFRIEVKQVKALLLTAGDNDLRNYLNGVFFRQYGTTLVACSTDGHRMLVMTVEQDHSQQAINGEFDGEVLVPRALLETACKFPVAKQTVHYLLFSVNGSTITVRTDSGTSTTGEVLDDAERFPLFARIIPSESTLTGETACYQSNYVADFCKIAKLLCDYKAPGIRIRYNGDRAAIIQFTHNITAWGVLMPMRADEFCPLPTTFHAPPEQFCGPLQLPVAIADAEATTV